MTRKGLVQKLSVLPYRKKRNLEAPSEQKEYNRSHFKKR
jgi:hypothetical protein